MSDSAWVQAEVSKVTTWITRKRHLGLALIRFGVLLLVAAAAGGFVFEAKGVAGVVDVIKFSTGDGPSGLVLSLVAYLGASLVLFGTFIVYKSWCLEQQEAESNRVVAVELRGLVDTSDHPLKEGLPSSLRGRKVDCLVDVRQLLKGAPPNVSDALKEIEHIRMRLRSERGSTAHEHFKVVAGGVLQVPLQFYAGIQLDDEGKTTLMEWERTSGRWLELDKADDGRRFSVEGLDFPEKSSEAVLAVSATYVADQDSIAATFPNLPVVRMALPNPRPNTLWSEHQQAELTQQFIETMVALGNQGVKTVHLVLVASSTLSIRFGMAYDIRNMPKILCYQREADHIPPYPWSVQMPSASQPAAYVPTPKQAVVIT